MRLMMRQQLMPMNNLTMHRHNTLHRNRKCNRKCNRLPLPHRAAWCLWGRACRQLPLNRWLD